MTRLGKDLVGYMWFIYYSKKEKLKSSQLVNTQNRTQNNREGDEESRKRKRKKKVEMKRQGRERGVHETEGERET
jgi:hypothetical protein